MSSLLLPLSFALGILGLGMAAVNWLWPAPPKAPTPDPRWLTALKELGRRMDRNTWIMVGIAAAVSFFIALFTGLLVYLVALPGAVILLRLAFGSGGGSAQIEKLAQMEMWTRSLSGLIVAGTSLETALAASMPNAGDLIRDEIATMNARIKAGWPTADALKRLGLEWGDQTGDLVVMQLILAANQRGQGLANSLDDLSTSVEEEVSKRRAIYADRAGARREARIVITIVVISLCLVPGMGGPMAAYQTPLGQALYLVLALVTAGLIIWMTRVVAPPPQVRLLTARSSS